MPEPTRRNFGIRLPVELITAIDARATGTGQTKTQITEAALCAYLGLEVGNDAPDVMQRLANVEQRLTIVERRLTPPPATPATEGTSTGQSLGAGMAIGDALIAAGAPLEPRQCRGDNRSRDLRAKLKKDGKVALGAAEWLQANGWVKLGKDRWAPPQGLRGVVTLPDTPKPLPHGPYRG